MLKLKEILDLRDNINNEISILETLSETYLDLIDDDLFSVDLEARPFFVGELLTDELILIGFCAERQLRQKHILRFCDDFGLELVSEEKKENNYWDYLFKMK